MRHSKQAVMRLIAMAAACGTTVQLQQSLMAAAMQRPPRQAPHKPTGIRAAKRAAAKRKGVRLNKTRHRG